MPARADLRPGLFIGINVLLLQSPGLARLRRRNVDPVYYGILLFKLRRRCWSRQTGRFLPPFPQGPAVGQQPRRPIHWWIDHGLPMIYHRFIVL
jgi:hypothetical protein